MRIETDVNGGRMFTIQARDRVLTNTEYEDLILRWWNDQHKCCDPRQHHALLVTAYTEKDVTISNGRVSRNLNPWELMRFWKDYRCKQCLK